MCVHSMYAQVAPNKTKTEIVMTVDELQYLLEQIGRAELTNLRDKELDSMLSAVKYKQKEMPYTSAVAEESKFATKSPTVAVGTATVPFWTLIFMGMVKSYKVPFFMVTRV